MPLRDYVRPRPLLLAVALGLFCPALAQAQQEDEVVRVTSELVQTDVAVFDKRGRFVDGLRPEQFELQVNGRAQAIAFFERVRAGSRREESQLARAAARVPGAGKSGGRARADGPEPAGRLIFFFIDDLHLSPASVERARAALQRYVEHAMSPGDQVAIVSEGGQVGFLQQLTDNRAVLRAAIGRLGYRQTTEVYTGKTQISEYAASQVLDSGNRELYAYPLESTKLEQQMGPGSRHGDHALAAFDFDAAGSRGKALADVAGAAIDDRGQFGSFKQLLTVTPDPADGTASRPVIWRQRLHLKPGLYQVRVALRERATGRVGSAMQWVEIPDLSKGDFALSSIFLGERNRQAAGAEREAGRPRSVAVDVDRRFARAGVLRFQTYVYNAARTAGADGRDVQLRAQVFRGSTPLITTQTFKAPAAADPARLPFWSELSLEQLPPGHYVLQLTATDRAANRTAVERVGFYVE